MKGKEEFAMSTLIYDTNSKQWISHNGDITMCCSKCGNNFTRKNTVFPFAICDKCSIDAYNILNGVDYEYIPMTGYGAIGVYEHLDVTTQMELQKFGCIKSSYLPKGCSEKVVEVYDVPAGLTYSWKNK